MGCTMMLARANDWPQFQSLKIPQLMKLIDTDITKHTQKQKTYIQISIVSFELWYIDIQNKSPEVEYSTYVLQQLAAITSTFSHITIYAHLTTPATSSQNSPSTTPPESRRALSTVQNYSQTSILSTAERRTALDRFSIPQNRRITHKK